MPSVKKKNGEFGSMEQIFNKLQKEIGDPVDFELPDWLNKWKPTPYKFIKRNIYLTKKIKKRPEDDGIFCSCRSSSGSPGVCDRDCLCGMLQSSCSSGCQCGSSCLNKPFHQRPAKKMKIVQTQKCGSGIVADEDIKQGEFVIEYVGEVIDDQTCEERLWKMKHSGETNFYLCEINRDMVIDATYKGNKSRYINHSCCPNTEMQKWFLAGISFYFIFMMLLLLLLFSCNLCCRRIDGETRIGIFATRDIEKGEHLTYDYQFVQFGADQVCHCGAASCRQKLGKPNKPKTPSSDAALKIVACQVAMNSPRAKAVLHQKDAYANGASSAGVRIDPAPRKCTRNCIGKLVRINSPVNKRSFGVVKRFDITTHKHLIMFEDGSLEFLDLSKEEWELL